MSNATLEYGVLFDCTVWLMDVPVQTWNELPCPSGLDGSCEKEVWCLVSDPYLSATRSSFDGQRRLVVAPRFRNCIRIEH